jgi:hypothetical protein
VGLISLRNGRRNEGVETRSGLVSALHQPGTLLFFSTSYAGEEAGDKGEDCRRQEIIDHQEVMKSGPGLWRGLGRLMEQAIILAMS